MYMVGNYSGGSFVVEEQNNLHSYKKKKNILLAFISLVLAMTGILFFVTANSPNIVETITSSTTTTAATPTTTTPTSTTTTDMTTTTAATTTIVRIGYDYLYVPLYTQLFTFKVKSKKAVLITLSAEEKGSNVNEIIIGGWGNSKSTIRRGKQGSSISGGFTSTPQIVSSTELRGFWITTEMDNGKRVIKVGKDGESTPFMTGVDNNPLKHLFVGLAGWGFDPTTYVFPTPTRPETMSTTTTTTQSCGSSWTQFGSHCYKYFAKEKITWPEAKVRCEQEGAHLTSIHSPEENQFMVNLYPQNSIVWIGANDLDTEGTFVWTDGSALDYSDWAPGQPSNLGGVEHCVEMGRFGEMLWNDQPCNDQQGYSPICKKK